MKVGSCFCLHMLEVDDFIMTKYSSYLPTLLILHFIIIKIFINSFNKIGILVITIIFLGLDVD